MSRMTLTILLSLLFAATPLARAQDGDSETERVLCPICATANSEAINYPQKVGSTFLRGALNLAFGWTEVILQPAKEAKASGHLGTGIVKGMQQGVSRTLAGAAELATFWTPKIQGEYFHPVKNCPLDR